jgi:hypothetical protein
MKERRKEGRKMKEERKMKEGREEDGRTWSKSTISSPSPSNSKVPSSFTDGKKKDRREAGGRHWLNELRTQYVSYSGILRISFSTRWISENASRVRTFPPVKSFA